MKRSSLQGCLVALLLLSQFSASADDFFAYYTRLPYEIPIERARSYIPHEPLPEDMSPRAGHDSDVSDPSALTGKFADLIVQVSDGRQLIFSRAMSYLPYWKTENGTWPFENLIPRQEDIGCLYSYVQLIESTTDHARVHWRYIPDLKNPNGLHGEVHEYFDVSPDGKVTRKVKRGAVKLEDYLDSKNVTIQEIQLKPDGINQVSLREAKLSKQPGPAVNGSPVKGDMAGTPVSCWTFDEGLRQRTYEQRDQTQESVSKTCCPVEGNITLWKQGVSGTALAFDGYQSSVVLPTAQAPKIQDTLTVEGWVALSAYPWNWAPIVHQSNMDPGPIEKGTYDEEGKDFPRKPGKGYYLGVDAYGYPIFVVGSTVVKASVKLSTFRWTHIAGTYGNRQMRIYVDGRECGVVESSEDIDLPGTDVIIGLNNVPGRATDPVREPNCNLPAIYGIEGLIDEVRIYNTVLDAQTVRESYAAMRPDKSILNNPDLQRYTLPGHTGVAPKFGAQYTDLKYNELWDNLWRTSGSSDVLVKFDTAPTSIVFWRGTNGGANWVTDKNLWMADQSVELGGVHGCSEHMSDKQCRHAHVRIIENTDARVVLHWRYPSIDVGYLFPGIRYWTDEYYYIYPDCSAVRKVRFRDGNAGWHDVQFLSQPGTTCLDTVNLQAVTVANLNGDVHKLTWSGSNGVPENPLDDSSISLINFKSDYKVFLVYPEGVDIGMWGKDEQSPYTNDPFAGPWNHWPVSQMPSDGRYATSSDRLTHAAFGGGGDLTKLGNMILYGLTNKPIKDLVPLGRFWNRAPHIEGLQGGQSQGFSKEQRAYLFQIDGDKLSFAINASQDQPVVNPCFVISGWGNRHQAATIKVNGRACTQGPKFRQGIETDTNGKPLLVVWLDFQSTRPTTFEVAIELGKGAK